MKFIKLFAIFMSLFCALSVNAKTINFTLVTDVHYNIPASDIAKGKKADAAKVLKCFVARMNEQNQDFVVFLGDNIDKAKPELLKGFMNEIKPIKRPYYLVVGNHDSYKYSGMDRKQFADIVSADSPYQKKYQSNYVFHPSSDVVGIVLDSTSAGMPGTHGYFSEDTLKWLDNTLTEYKNKKVIIFQHVPIKEPIKNESHNILNADEYKKIIDKHDNILMIASGHYHFFAAAQDERGIYHLSVPELLEPPYQYVNVKLEYKKIPFMKASDFKFDGAIREAL